MIRKHLHTWALATLLTSTSSLAIADTFHSEFNAQLSKLYGKLSGMKPSESFISPIEPGELRVYKREGGYVIPLQRNPNDYRTALTQATPLAWLEEVENEKQKTIRKKLVRETSYGKGQIIFDRRNMNERRLDGILRSVCKFLDVDVDSKSHSDLGIVVSWDDITLAEFMPSQLSAITTELRSQGKDPYAFLKGIDSTHESWIILKTVQISGLKLEISSERPISYTDLHLTNLVTFGRSVKSNGNYCFELNHPTTIASYAENISRGTIYEYAGLRMPKR